MRLLGNFFFLAVKSSDCFKRYVVEQFGQGIAPIKKIYCAGLQTCATECSLSRIPVPRMQGCKEMQGFVKHTR